MNQNQIQKSNKKNYCAKRRDINNPYEIYTAQLIDGGQFEWRVLKKYQAPCNEHNNAYARWHVGARSPFTFGSWEYGDEYVTNVVRGTLVPCGTCLTEKATHAVDVGDESTYYCDGCFETKA